MCCSWLFDVNGCLFHDFDCNELGGGKSPAVDQAVNRLYNAGIPVLVAAGNDARLDACNGSPSGARNAFTVGATHSGDGIASFSSWGQCLDIFGPGVDITSAWIGSTNAYNRISGTSMATPHVAGVAALLMSTDPSLTSTQAVYNKLIQTSTKNVVSGPLRGSPNRMLFNSAV
jgi:subtilisin family serine protease